MSPTAHDLAALRKSFDEVLIATSRHLTPELGWALNDLTEKLDALLAELEKPDTQTLALLKGAYTERICEMCNVEYTPVRGHDCKAVPA